MFDDLLGSGSESSEEQVIEEKELISVSDTALLDHTVSVLLSCGQTLLAELLILEN